MTESTDLKGIRYEEAYMDTEFDILTLYFTAPKEFMGISKKYPDAVSTEISIEFPGNHVEPAFATAMISPTRGEGCGLYDYEWSDIDFPYEMIDKMIAIYLENRPKNRIAEFIKGLIF